MATWYEDTVKAMRNLGGVAEYARLYAEIERLRGSNMPGSWQAIVRSTIETNSSDSEAFGGKNDAFYSVHGLGSGVWGLRELLVSTPIALDSSEPVIPVRAKCETYRILRDTQLAREIKLLHNNKCQICGLALELSNGTTYSEAHHIRPLGSPHNGPDTSENILILCPNHHAQCDYNAISLSLSSLHTHPKHHVGQEFIDYHNERANER